MQELYQRFLETITYERYLVMMSSLLIVLIFSIRQIVFNHKAKLPKDIAKKFKRICELENRNPIEQEKYIIKKYIEEYEKSYPGYGGTRWKTNGSYYDKKSKDWVDPDFK